MFKANIDRKEYVYDIKPDTCPICKHGIEVRSILGSRIINREHVNSIQMVFKCPRQNCQNLFIATYNYNEYPGGFTKFYQLTRLEPVRPKRIIISDNIKNLSPNYCDLINQANNSEQYGLIQISGCGYRKSLEFLIKDYCIQIHPEKSDEIKSKFLGNCINDYLPEGKIKECAKRATWLGNDETHYVRKWDDKDIDDLKKLIKLTETWIESELLTQDYLEDMN